jgi:ABC-2 type transport system permease protein
MSRAFDRRSYVLVARREFVERARDRSFRISTGVTMAFLIGFILVSSVSRGAATYRVGVVGADGEIESVRLAQAAAHALGFAITVRAYADQAEAEAAVRDGGVDAALMNGKIVVKSSGPEQLIVALQASSQREEVRRALAGAGLTTAQIDAALDRPAPPVESLEPVQTARGQAAVVAFVGVLALYGQLFAYGYWVASGVVEEKASRIIEVLLGAIRPSQLLRGKIFGIGALGLCQLTLIAGTGLGVAIATHVLSFPAGAAAAAVYVVLWFLLGFSFYASLFAVAGALVSRQEDLQATITPLSLVIVGSFVLGIQAVQNPTSSLATIASMLPFSAPLTMPSRMVLGQASPVQVVLSAVLTVASALLLVPVATRAYSRSVLRSGRIKLREAFARGRVG